MGSSCLRAAPRVCIARRCDGGVARCLLEPMPASFVARHDFLSWASSASSSMLSCPGASISIGAVHSPKFFRRSSVALGTATRGLPRRRIASGLRMSSAGGSCPATISTPRVRCHTEPGTDQGHVRYSTRSSCRMVSVGW